MLSQPCDALPVVGAQPVGAQYGGAQSGASGQYGTGPLYVAGQQTGPVSDQANGHQTYENHSYDDHSYDNQGYDDQGYAAPGREEQVPPGLEFAGRFGNRGYSLYGEAAEYADAAEGSSGQQTPQAGFGAPAGQFAETAPALSAPVPADAAFGDQWSPNGAQPRQPTGPYPAYGPGQPPPGTAGQAPADGATLATSSPVISSSLATSSLPTRESSSPRTKAGPETRRRARRLEP